jgi:trimeric autotransporter adhesin
MTNVSAIGARGAALLSVDDPTERQARAATSAMRWTRPLLPGTLLAVSAGSLAVATGLLASPPTWLPGFEHGGVDGVVHDVVAFDPDLDGPEQTSLYACGEFTTAGGRHAECMAKWDGDEWSAVVSELDGNRIHDLLVYDEDGPGPTNPGLIATGFFTGIDGVSASCVALWRDGEWSRLGDGILLTQSSVAWCCVVFDEDGEGPQKPSLFVGGDFRLTEDGPALFVARWDGQSWSPVAVNTDQDEATVWTMEVCDDDGAGPRPASLFAAGHFDQIDGVVATNIGRWDGQHWSATGAGLPGWNGISSLRVFDPDGAGTLPPALHAGGHFDKAQGAAADHLATWDGDAWSEVGGGTEHEIYQLAVGDVTGDGRDELCVASWFQGLDGVQDTSLAAWDGAAWRALGEVVVGPEALEFLDIDGAGPIAPSLYLGDQTCGGCDPSEEFNGVGQWSGSAWRGLGCGASRTVRTILATADMPGMADGVYIGGHFRRVAGLAADRIAFWDGSAWSALGEGIDESVWALSTFDGDGDGRAELYVGGGVYRAGDAKASGLARWDGASWEAVGSFDAANLSVATYALTCFDDDADGPRRSALYATGMFATVDGVIVNGIARFDGSEWSPLGVGLTPNYNRAWALAVFDEDGPGPLAPALFVGGEFESAGGIGARGLARWDGQFWSAVADQQGGVVDGAVYTLCVWDPDGPGIELPVLCVGGDFASAGVSKSANVAAWDGKVWKPFATGLKGEGYHPVRSLAALDPDGAGPLPGDLYAGGNFGTNGGQHDANIARWDGVKWQVMGGGANGEVNALAPCDEDGAGHLPPRLWAGGEFTLAGDISSGHLAHWGSAPTPCLADCDHSGSLDSLDYLCFVGLFGAQDPAADCDASASWDLFDFLCFVNAFNAGCP